MLGNADRKHKENERGDRFRENSMRESSPSFSTLIGVVEIAAVAQQLHDLTGPFVPENDQEEDKKKNSNLRETCVQSTDDSVQYNVVVNLV